MHLQQSILCSSQHNIHTVNANVLSKCKLLGNLPLRLSSAHPAPASDATAGRVTAPATATVSALKAQSSLPGNGVPVVLCCGAWCIVYKCPFTAGTGCPRTAGTNWAILFRELYAPSTNVHTAWGSKHSSFELVASVAGCQDMHF